MQFEKNSFTNRNRIRTTDGCCWLTVPVLSRHRFGVLPINAVEIDNTSRWCVPAPHPRSPEALRAAARRWGSVIGLQAAEALELVRAVAGGTASELGL